jgi:hypothetical protein
MTWRLSAKDFVVLLELRASQCEQRCVKVSWYVMLYSVVDRYQRFGGPYSSIFKVEVLM